MGLSVGLGEGKIILCPYLSGAERRSLGRSSHSLDTIPTVLSGLKSDLIVVLANVLSTLITQAC
jgi:hypothetical protein